MAQEVVSDEASLHAGVVSDTELAVLVVLVLEWRFGCRWHHHLDDVPFFDRWQLLVHIHRWVKVIAEDRSLVAFLVVVNRLLLLSRQLQTFLWAVLSWPQEEIILIQLLELLRVENAWLCWLSF